MSVIPNRGVFASCMRPTVLSRRLEGRIEYFVCGQCHLCLARRVREWKDRIFHEYDYWGKGLFITLTYNGDNIPPRASLCKSDLQKFWKRLRKSLGRRRIKYFAVGEYGESDEYGRGADNIGRPHYHAIVLGLEASDLEVITDAWALGFVHIGMINPTTVNYVLGYTQKKMRGSDKYIYDSYGILPPFQTQSKGIGKRWLMDNLDLVSKDLSYTVNGVSRGLPRYYVKVMKEIKGDEYVKEILRDRARDYMDALEDEYRSTKNPSYVRPSLDLLARGLTDDFIDWLKATAKVKYDRMLWRLSTAKRRDVYG